MNYLLKTNNRIGVGGTGGRGKKPLSLSRIISAIIVACIVLWWIFFTPQFMRAIGHSVAGIITSSEHGVGRFVGGIVTYFKSKNSLAAENEALRDTIFNQNVAMVNFELIKKQNAELKEALNRIDKTDLIAAAIVRSVAASPYDTFIIDGGKAAGIVPGDIVLVNSAVPVGYVSKVFDRTAEVTMYSAPGQTIEGVLTFNEISEKKTNASAHNGSTTTSEGTDDEGVVEGVRGTGRLRTLFVTLTGTGGGNFDIRLTKDIDVPSGAHIAMPGLPARTLATVYGSELDAKGGSRVLRALAAVNMLQQSIVYIEPGHSDGDRD